MRATKPGACLLGLFALVACKDDVTSPEAPPSAAAVETAATPTATATSAEPALRAAKSKPFAAATTLGTLPEGVGIAVGEKAPDFTLPSVEGNPVKLSELLERSEVLLVFYRGGW